MLATDNNLLFYENYDQQCRLAYYQYKLQHRKPISYVVEHKAEWVTIPVSVAYAPIYSMYSDETIHANLRKSILDLGENWGVQVLYGYENKYVLKYHYMEIHLEVNSCENDVATINMTLKYDVMDKYNNTVDYLANEELGNMYSYIQSNL
jgi:hypothetical protein